MFRNPLLDDWTQRIVVPRTGSRYTWGMGCSGCASAGKVSMNPIFRDKRTARFAQGERIAAFSSFERTAERRLRVVQTATSIADLRQMPGWRLEALKGDRAGQWSIRINDQWRICFEWPDDSPHAVNIEIADYH